MIKSPEITLGFFVESFFIFLENSYISYVNQLKQKDMSEQRKLAAVAINKMIAESGNKIFMGMIHQVYGPLRGLNYILTNPNVEEILDCLDEQAAGIELEDQMKLIKKVEKEEPKNVVETGIKVWTKTGMAVQLMILPYEMVEQAENHPTEVSSLKEGRSEILKNLAFTAPLQTKDPFFFRVGII
jgi:hypothetical protein